MRQKPTEMCAMHETLSDRLTLDCLYGESDNPQSADASLGTASAESKLDEILQCLYRMESRWQHPQVPVTPGSSTPSSQAARGRTDSPGPTPGPLNCQIKPALLRPSYWNFIAVMNVAQTLTQENTTAHQIAQRYTATVHTWMPLLHSDDLARKVVDVGDTNCSPQFAVLLLAIHGLVSVKKTTPRVTEELPIYLLSKHLFATTSALSGPSWDLVNAGIVLALFEHMHGIVEKSKMTIGTCMTMLNLLIEKQNRGDESYSSADDVRRTWWATAIVDRYINPLPTDPGGRFLISYGDVTGIASTAETRGVDSQHAAQNMQQPSAITPWKSPPSDPTLSGEARAAQFLGEVHQFIHRAELALDIDCHTYHDVQERMATALASLKSTEYCPFHNDSHSGQWTCLSALLSFYCFCYQKTAQCGLDEIFSTVTIGLKEAVAVANERAEIFSQSPEGPNLSRHEVSPSMIASLFWGALGTDLLAQWGELNHGVRHQCRDLLMGLNGDWGLPAVRLSYLNLPSLSIYELLQKS